MLIYLLIVGWFGSFKVPLVMMIAIPLSLVGILPGHWLFGAFFTATSMIGFIALAGIMVRNSVLLIDFVNLSLERGRQDPGRGGDRGGRGAAPSDPADRRHRGRRSVRDPLRSDLPGPGDRVDDRGVRVDGLTLVVIPLVYWMMQRRQEPDRSGSGIRPPAPEGV